MSRVLKISEIPEFDGAVFIEHRNVDYIEPCLYRYEQQPFFRFSGKDQCGLVGNRVDIGAPTLMVVALTAISSYVIPNLYEPISILKFIFIIAGGILGIWGIMIVFTAVLINICSKESYGIPFTSPISPFNIFAMRDVLVRSGWSFLSKKSIKVQDLPGSKLNSK